MCSRNDVLVRRRERGLKYPKWVVGVTVYREVGDVSNEEGSVRGWYGSTKTSVTHT